MRRRAVGGVNRGLVSEDAEAGGRGTNGSSG